jgi:hypothetical protein
MLARALASASLIFLPAVLIAQPAPRPSCDSPEHRQFDFWIGEWVVFNRDGEQVGRNRIERVENGCGLQENWTGANGVTGRSLNGYSPGDRTWHQFWIGAGGLVMHLAGRFEGPTLTLEGVVDRRDQPPQHQRLAFTRNPDGTVRQLWEQSSDRGATWQVVFDGRYVRSR